MHEAQASVLFVLSGGVVTKRVEEAVPWALAFAGGALGRAGLGSSVDLPKTSLSLFWNPCQGLEKERDLPSKDCPVPPIDTPRQLLLA